jgi:hypothetical protein
MTNSTPASDGLDGWIAALRDRLARGAFANLAPFDIGDGTGPLPGELVVRIMLADLADLDDPDGSWRLDATNREERRLDLHDAFRRLRELLG